MRFYSIQESEEYEKYEFKPMGFLFHLQVFGLKASLKFRMENAFWLILEKRNSLGNSAPAKVCCLLCAKLLHVQWVHRSAPTESASMR